MIPLGYFLFLCPALIRLMTDCKSGRPSLKSVCTDSVFKNINIIQDLTFLHLPKAVKLGLFSVIPELIFICDEYQFLSQNEISYRMPPSLTFFNRNWPLIRFVNFKDISNLSAGSHHYYVTQTLGQHCPNITDRCLKSKSPVTSSGL